MPVSAGPSTTRPRSCSPRCEKVDTILTRTEKEALILESSLIKKHHPRYNVILRDDKSYPLIKVTVQEEWPRVIMTRRRRKDGARYFGPYSSPTAMWSSLKLISELFPAAQMHRQFAATAQTALSQPADGQMPCPLRRSCRPTLYEEHVRKIIMVLEGRNQDLIADLSSRMQTASENLEFEQAAVLRDQIQALTKTLEKQVISAEHHKDQDVFGFARKDTAVAITVLFIRSGLISGSRSFFLAEPYGDDPGHSRPGPASVL